MVVKKFVPITEAEAVLLGSLLLATVEGEMKALLIRTLWYTGARKSEVLALTVDDLLPNGNLRISWLKSRSKLRQDREIGIPPMLYQEINDYAATLPPHATLFPISGKYLWDICQWLGLRFGRKIHPHLFRHSRAIDLMRRTRNPAIVQAHMGHRSMETTLEYLRYITDEDAARTVRELPS